MLTWISSSTFVNDSSIVVVVVTIVDIIVVIIRARVARCAEMFLVPRPHILEPNLSHSF